MALGIGTGIQIVLMAASSVEAFIFFGVSFQGIAKRRLIRLACGSRLTALISVFNVSTAYLWTRRPLLRIGPEHKTVFTFDRGALSHVCTAFARIHVIAFAVWTEFPYCIWPENCGAKTNLR
jgi:hypothetical protein